MQAIPRSICSEALTFVNSIDYSALAEIGIELTSHTKVWPGHTVVTYPFYSDLNRVSNLEGVASKLSTEKSPCVNGYVHIPYCTGVCNYCAYSKSATRDRPRQERYLDAVRREVDFLERLRGLPLRFSSLYVGGGTPMALPLDLFRETIHFVSQLRIDAPETEATCEASPETILADDGLRKVAVLLASRFTRVSLGVEAFSDRLCELAGRRHGRSEGIEAVIQLRASGLRNFNIDLLYGLPEQQVEDWVDTLSVAVDLCVPSITLYPYRVKSKSKWGKVWQFEDAPNWELRNEVLMNALGRLYLTFNGYKQQSVNWFVKDDSFRFRHQAGKYEMRPLIGVGCSSYSFAAKCQWYNIYSEHNYVSAIVEDQKPFEVGRELTGSELELRFVLFGLKRGFEDREFAEQFGREVFEAMPHIKTLIERGVVSFDERHWTLTEIGKVFADDVAVFLHNVTSCKHRKASETSDARL